MDKVNYKQFNISREEREQEQRDISELRQYILALKKDKLGKLMCEHCGKEGVPLDIHHKRYGTDINFYDLELLCEDCHNSIIPSRFN